VDTVERIYGYFGDKMHVFNQANPPKWLNGDIIEIDETNIKWKDGSIEGDWVLGATNRETRECWLDVIQERTTGQMEPLIRRVAKEGTIVMSDALAAYPGIMERLKTTYRIINKEREGFGRVDPVSGIAVNVNRCEELWKDFRHLMEQRNMFSSKTRHRLIADFMYNRNKKSWLDLIKF